MSAGYWSDVVQSPIRAFRGHSTVNKFFRFVHRQPTNHPLTGCGGGIILLNSFSDDPVVVNYSNLGACPNIYSQIYGQGEVRPETIHRFIFEADEEEEEK